MNRLIAQLGVAAGLLSASAVSAAATLDAVTASYPLATTVTLVNRHLDTDPHAASSKKPLIVSARSADGTCTVRISFVTLNGGGASLVGRLEGGTCHGLSAKYGYAIGSFEADDKGGWLLDRVASITVTEHPP